MIAIALVLQAISTGEFAAEAGFGDFQARAAILSESGGFGGWGSAIGGVRYQRTIALALDVFAQGGAFAGGQSYFAFKEHGVRAQLGVPLRLRFGRVTLGALDELAELYVPFDPLNQFDPEIGVTLPFAGSSYGPSIVLAPSLVQELAPIAGLTLSLNERVFVPVFTPGRIFSEEGPRFRATFEMAIVWRPSTIGLGGAAGFAPDGRRYLKLLIAIA